MKRDKMIEQVKQLSIELHELCDNFMCSCEKEMTDPELCRSAEYRTCGTIAGAIEKAFTELNNNK